MKVRYLNCDYDRCRCSQNALSMVGKPGNGSPCYALQGLWLLLLSSFQALFDAFQQMTTNVDLQHDQQVSGLESRNESGVVIYLSNN